MYRNNPRHYRIVAEAMAKGVRACGDDATLYGENNFKSAKADIGVIYGWRNIDRVDHFQHFVYADFGYWQRERYYRVTVDGWSPGGYVLNGYDGSRLRSFGVEVKPWNRSGYEILIAGSKPKACADHGLGYMEWETKVAEWVRFYFPKEKVVYRPKPNDAARRRLIVDGVDYDEGILEDSLKRAKVVLTHHSNVTIDALTAGVPVYCHVGAATACSIQLSDVQHPPLSLNREQFLNNVAWLQWTVDEMASGVCWRNLKERGLLS